jgi:hypothetical protein
MGKEQTLLRVTNEATGGKVIPTGTVKNGGQVLLFDILISRDERRCSPDLIIDFGLTRDELRYIFDPKDVYGPDFPGETFRVLKEKEEKQFGEYRTHRLVLGAWDAMERAD